jgi:phosphoribosylamine--glycine ligase
MNILVLGGGGREHALAWGLKKSPGLGRLFVAPGNAGTARLAQNVAVAPENANDVLALCRRESIELVVIGPEAPLVAGVADVLRREKILVFGPSLQGALLEGSKSHAKAMMDRAGVPTARHATVRSVAEAAKALAYLGERVAVKADGLAAGKGVVMAGGEEEALAAVRAAVEKRAFGDAGASVVMEEWLEGEEISLMALVDETHTSLLPASQDHKRAFDGDQGPNTGGMGAYAPVPWLSTRELQEMEARCIAPMARALAADGIVYRGVLYAGIMRTREGPKVLEYNVRFGDPEAEALIPLTGNDLLETLAACASGELARLPAPRSPAKAALTVVVAARGYPGPVEKGLEIVGLDECQDREDGIVFHAGTKLEGGRVVTAGGRVLSITGLGSDLAEARRVAYDLVDHIHFEGMFCRRDIGKKASMAASFPVESGERSSP